MRAQTNKVDLNSTKPQVVSRDQAKILMDRFGPGGSRADEGGNAPEDAASGYVVAIEVRADGSFRVSKEGASSESTVGARPGNVSEGDSVQDYPSLAAALKGVMAIVEANPVGDRGRTPFETGWREG